MRINLVLVTPQIAAEWLKDNPNNRNLNAKLVADYAREMRAGLWLSNGETVKRAHDGVLLDGQHRLAAIVASDTAVEILVVEGLPYAAQDTMDSGRKRTTGDVMAIHGETNSNVLASVARRVWMWDLGNRKFTNTDRPSSTELLTVLEKYPSLRRSAEIGTRTNRSYRPAVATVVGTTHHILLQLDEGACSEFFAQLGTGVELYDGHPILTLRNRLLRDKVNAKNVPFHQHVGLYFRAWNALREGRYLATIAHTAEEPMVMPV